MKLYIKTIKNSFIVVNRTAVALIYKPAKNDTCSVSSFVKKL